MTKSMASRMESMEEGISEHCRGFARVILDLERRVKALSHDSPEPFRGNPPVPFASSALAAITFPGTGTQGSQTAGRQ
ncbi:MAG: hypothetical protein LBQ79_03590 [Deltaproteobacteria bacterium]|nr:hypothetical protein [Deltaproteobacteria bacterium]